MISWGVFFLKKTTSGGVNMTEAFEQNLINLGDIHSTGVCDWSGVFNRLFTVYVSFKRFIWMRNPVHECIK